MTQPIMWIKLERTLKLLEIDAFELRQVIDSGMLDEYVDYQKYTGVLFPQLIKTLDVERDIFDDERVFKLADVLAIKEQGLIKKEAIGLKPMAPDEPQQKTPPIFPIETRPGTTWKHIIMTVRNYEITEIKYPGGTENKLHKEMGLKQRGKGPLPGVLLRMYLPMAALKGCLPAQGNIEDIKGNIHRLRQCFKSIFPNISGDPIPFINNEYQTAFTLGPDPENFFNQMPDPTKDYVTSFIKAANRIKIK